MQRLTHKQVVTFSALIKVSSSLSFCGSSYIIYQCAKIISRRGAHTQQRKHRLSAKYNRILIGLSSCDLISSLGFFVSPSAVPFDETQEKSFYNAGNQLSCNIQGAMLQFGLLGGLFYNTCLAVYFCLFVYTKINGEEIADLHQSNSRARTDSDNETDNNTQGPDETFSRKEIMLHFCILFYPVFSTIILVIQGNFNPAGKFCYIRESPTRCVGDECIRGENSRLFRQLFVQIPCAVCVTIICTSILFVHSSVKKFRKQCLNKPVENLEETLTTKKSTLEENFTSKKSPSVEVYNDQTILSNSVNAVTLEENDTEGGSYQQPDIMKEDESSETQNTPKNMNSSIEKVCKKIRRLSILYLLALLSVWISFLIQSIIFPLFDKYPKVPLFPMIGPLQGLFNAIIFGNFNLFVFLYKHKLFIFAITCLSVLVYFVSCDPDTCV